MKPKFKVGEQVILQSKALPKYNGGPYTIKDTCYYDPYKTWAYILNEVKYTIEEWPCGDSSFLESALRKYYPPSEFSFKELMQSLTKENVWTKK